MEGEEDRQDPKLPEVSEDSPGRNTHGQERSIHVRNLTESGGVQDELRRQFHASSEAPQHLILNSENRYFPPGTGVYVYTESNLTSGTSSVSVRV